MSQDIFPAPISKLEELEELYPINGEQARDIEFLKVSGSACIDPDHDASNAASKDKQKFSAEMKNGIWELTYSFWIPVLIRGYIIETANDPADSDPKNWKVNC